MMIHQDFGIAVDVFIQDNKARLDIITHDK
jgi:hypothetical protein